MSWRLIPDASDFGVVVLARAKQRGITDIGPTKMCGILYLLDIEYVKRYSRTATAIEWKWDQNGPFHPGAAYGVANRDEVESVPNYYGKRYRLLVNEVHELEQRIEDVLGTVLDRFGAMNGTDIKAYCYEHTEPMIEVQDSGERGDILDMSLVRQDPDLDDAVLERLAAIRKLRESPLDNVAAASGLVELIEETEEMRERAAEALGL